MPTERGDATFRLIAVMALAAALAWTIPFVFLGRQTAEHTAALTGASTDAEDGGGSGVEGIGAGPIAAANDAQAQATLNNAIRVAQIYFAEQGSYEGFSPQEAAGYDPTVTYTTGPPAPGLVSLRGLSLTTVVFVTIAAGAPLCAAAEADVVTFGRVDAQTPAECTGGW